MGANWDEVTRELAGLAEHYDTRSCWPQRSIDIAAAAGCWRWIVPKKWGGDELGGRELLSAYEAIARGCLTTALIITQRDGACDLIAHGENEALKERLLPAYAKAQRFTSIGIAQLTTSRGSGKPAMRASQSDGGYVLDGVIPWVTGAIQCDEIVTGAVLGDGKQLLACVSTESPALIVEPAMQLMALEASSTSRVRCKELKVSAADVIRGPAEKTLDMRTPVKPLVVSAVGLGLAGALHDALLAEADRLAPELREIVERLAARYQQTRERLLAASDELNRPEAQVPAAKIRVSVNELVTKLAIAHLTISRGTGYARPHLAERLLREAMFFHVWAAPQEVQVETLRAMG